MYNESGKKYDFQRYYYKYTNIDGADDVKIDQNSKDAESEESNESVTDSEDDEAYEIKTKTRTLIRQQSFRNIQLPGMSLFKSKEDVKKEKEVE